MTCTFVVGHHTLTEDFDTVCGRRTVLMLDRFKDERIELCRRHATFGRVDYAVRNGYTHRWLEEPNGDVATDQPQA